MQLIGMIVFFFGSLAALAAPAAYPPEWWAPVPEKDKFPWEILPQEADPAKNEVILSKRTELGVFSNFAHTPFVYAGDDFASVEGFWQMMKYPEERDSTDPRHASTLWPYRRSQVSRLHGFSAKEAGDIANEINKSLGINWVSYRGNRFNYKDNGLGSRLHYHHVSRAIEAKVRQNKDVRKLLLKTKGLKLRPDHVVPATNPPAYHYYDILMELRTRLELEDHP